MSGGQDDGCWRVRSAPGRLDNNYQVDGYVSLSGSNQVSVWGG